MKTVSGATIVVEPPAYYCVLCQMTHPGWYVCAATTRETKETK